MRLLLTDSPTGIVRDALRELKAIKGLDRDGAYLLANIEDGALLVEVANEEALEALDEGLCWMVNETCVTWPNDLRALRQRIEDARYA